MNTTARPAIDVQDVVDRVRKLGRNARDLVPNGMKLPGSLLVIVVVLFAVYFRMLGSTAPVTTGREIRLDQLRALVAAGEVTEAVVHDEDARIVVRSVTGVTSWVAYPQSDAATADLIDQLTASGAKLEIDQQPGKARTEFLVQFLLPLVILAGLFGLVFLVIMRGGAGAGEFAAFSKVKKRRAVGAQITFADVAAADEAILELREIVEFLQDPTKWLAVGARAPKGVLLSGPPGTGKTLLARAVAGESGTNFYSMSGSEFVESLVGVGAGRVRDLFRQARENAPAIIFIDEIDAAGRQRGAGMGQGNDEREQTLNQLLVEMDGFSSAAGVVVLGATNRPDILDPALLRPGRFDRQIVVDAPDVRGRVQLLELYTRDRDLDPGVDLERVAKQVPGFTGAEIANLVNEGALLAVRDARSAITNTDLEQAVDRVLAGPERRSHVLSVEEKRIVAVHEVGHAVVAAAVGMDAGVQKLSIVARGRTLGHVTTYQMSDRLVLKRSDLRRRLVTYMGGIAAEQLELGETTSAGESDLREATNLARSMVATLGMNEAIGRYAVMQQQGQVFLGRDLAKAQDVSPATLEVVDRELKALLDEAERDAVRILNGHSDLVARLVPLLIEAETLSGPTLDAALAGVTPLDVNLAASPATNGHAAAPKRRPRTALPPVR
ncbi:MAG: ATP-dependent zinc metalloprotease FtsH [Microthrixaceae bacterium]